MAVWCGSGVEPSKGRPTTVQHAVFVVGLARRVKGHVSRLRSPSRTHCPIGVWPVAASPLTTSDEAGDIIGPSVRSSGGVRRVVPSILNWMIDRLNVKGKDASTSQPTSVSGLAHRREPSGQEGRGKSRGTMCAGPDASMSSKPASRASRRCCSRRCLGSEGGWQGCSISVRRPGYRSLQAPQRGRHSSQDLGAARVELKPFN